MRPLTLKIKGFTSFRDEQELSFRDLDVFAVTGPTGAGKSSLLDAITYVLYGEVERVGRECSQLVSHSLPRMAVTLNFTVDQHEYRITRTTPARSGQTKVLLERYVDDQWRSYGEGADRVRDCNEYVIQLIGLDYTAFTRSVLLPQGKFAEFMAGKPEDRRAIMSDLLGLGLFKRMAQRAGRLAADADNFARVKTDLLKSQYVDVTLESLADARTAAAEADSRVARLTRAMDTVQRLHETWRSEQQRAQELQYCAVDLHTWRLRLSNAVSTVETLASELALSDTRLTEADAAVAEAQRRAEVAAQARAESETRWGNVPELAPALATARRLPGARQQVQSKREELEAGRARTPETAAALALAGQAHAEQQTKLAQVRMTLDAAREHEREVEHANMAAALSAGLLVGDPCPVCGDPLEKLPEAPAAAEVSDASRGRKAAEKALSTAQQALTAAERGLQRIARDIEEDERTVARLAAELASLEASVAESERELVTALRGPLPEDPVAALNERITQLNELSARERACTAAVPAAEHARVALQHAAELARERLAAQRTALAESADSLLTRASVALNAHLDKTVLHEAPPPEASAPELARFGKRKIEAVGAFATDVERSASEAAAAEAKLLAQALPAIHDLVSPTATLSATVEALTQASADTVARRAAAAQRAELLSAALDKRHALESEIAGHQAQATRYQTLATDLRADRLIAFLQDEALRTLAEVGSRYLYDLSSERYELTVERDFYVVDKWSADEKRSVRTLSGGETFLASLALALALSEQVRALSVTERARLDSLFLDEGFGTLDPDTLRVVVESIEKLSGGGRLVGVITHVPELAEQFQRIEVKKTPRGSHLVTQP